MFTVRRHNANAMLPAVLFGGLYVPCYAVQYSSVISNLVAVNGCDCLSCEYCFKLFYGFIVFVDVECWNDNSIFYLQIIDVIAICLVITFIVVNVLRNFDVVKSCVMNGNFKCSPKPFFLLFIIVDNNSVLVYKPNHSVRDGF